MTIHEHNEIVHMLVEINDGLYEATTALQKKDYAAIAIIANKLKNTSHTLYATSFNLKRKEVHG